MNIISTMYEPLEEKCLHSSINFLSTFTDFTSIARFLNFSVWFYSCLFLSLYSISICKTVHHHIRFNFYLPRMHVKYFFLASCLGYPSSIFLLVTSFHFWLGHQLNNHKPNSGCLLGQEHWPILSKWADFLTVLF